MAMASGIQKCMFLVGMLTMEIGLSFAQSLTPSMLHIRRDVQTVCPVSYSVPKIFIRGNGMVGGRNDLPAGCNVIEYFLTNQNLSPDEASKSIEFLILPVSLDKTLADRSGQYVHRDRRGSLKVDKRLDFDSGTCPAIASHKVLEVSGVNWSGWVIESVFRKPISLRAKKFCPESSNRYQCINMAIGNEKASAVLHPRCFLRRPDNTLHTEMSFDMFMEMMKTWQFKE
jgi:hypothetical protein